jgi:hypothetical protein
LWKKARELPQGPQATENGGRASMTPDMARRQRMAMTAEGQTPPQGACNEGEDAPALKATTLAQSRQRQQQHNAGNDASVMQAKRQRNARKCQRCTGRTFEGQLSNDAGATPVTRTAPHW